MKEIRKQMGITQAECAKLLGVCLKTVNNWEANETPRMARLAIERIQQAKDKQVLSGLLRDMAERLESDK